MRRTPDATALSPVTEIRPISPVRRTWVPPHSSTDQPSALLAVFARGPAHRHHAHLVAIFLAEQRPRAGIARIVHRHQARGDLVILQHDIVGDILDPARVRPRVIGFGCTKSKRSRSGATSEPRCAMWSPSTWRKRLVQQMRRGMVGADRGAPGMIDFELQRGCPASACPARPCRDARRDRRPSSGCR